MILIIENCVTKHVCIHTTQLIITLLCVEQQDHNSHIYNLWRFLRKGNTIYCTSTSKRPKPGFHLSAPLVWIYSKVCFVKVDFRSRTMQDLFMDLICLALCVIFPSILAASCENMVRLADLQDIIKNQTKLIESQAKFMENQTRLYEQLKTTVEQLSTSKRLLRVGIL